MLFSRSVFVHCVDWLNLIALFCVFVFFFVINQQGNFTEVDASRVMRQMTEAIQYLHEQGIVHRDLKVGCCDCSRAFPRHCLPFSPKTCSLRTRRPPRTFS